MGGFLSRAIGDGQTRTQQAEIRVRVRHALDTGDPGRTVVEGPFEAGHWPLGIAGSASVQRDGQRPFLVGIIHHGDVDTGGRRRIDSRLRSGRGATPGIGQANLVHRPVTGRTAQIQAHGAKAERPRDRLGQNRRGGLIGAQIRRIHEKPDGMPIDAVEGHRRRQQYRLPDGHRNRRAIDRIIDLHRPVTNAARLGRVPHEAQIEPRVVHVPGQIVVMQRHPDRRVVILILAQQTAKPEGLAIQGQGSARQIVRERPA